LRASDQPVLVLRPSRQLLLGIHGPQHADGV
jgi:hypothetical protein